MFKIGDKVMIDHPSNMPDDWHGQVGTVTMILHFDAFGVYLSDPPLWTPGTYRFYGEDLVKLCDKK